MLIRPAPLDFPETSVLEEAASAIIDTFEVCMLFAALILSDAGHCQLTSRGMRSSGNPMGIN